MNHLHYNYPVFEYTNKRFSGVILGASVLAASIGGGVAMYEGSQNREAAQNAQDQYNAQPGYVQIPDYPESTAARDDWWTTLQDWQEQPGYGVVQQDYEDIYNKAAQKINQYYWGSPSAPGLMDKVSAGAARRGVAESPAIDVLKQRTGVEEANRLGQLSTDVNQAKATANEQGRVNWLTSLQNLSGLKPAFMSKTNQYGITPASSGMSSLFGTATSGIQDYYQNQANQNFTQSLYDKYFGAGAQPTITQSSLTDYTDTSGWGAGTKSLMTLGGY